MYRLVGLFSATGQIERTLNNEHFFVQPLQAFFHISIDTQYSVAVLSTAPICNCNSKLKSSSVTKTWRDMQINDNISYQICIHYSAICAILFC